MGLVNSIDDNIFFIGKIIIISDVFWGYSFFSSILIYLVKGRNLSIAVFQNNNCIIICFIRILIVDNIIVLYPGYPINCRLIFQLPLLLIVSKSILYELPVRGANMLFNCTL